MGNKRAKLARFEDSIIVGDVMTDAIGRWRQLLSKIPQRSFLAVCSVVPETGRELYKWANENDVSLWFLTSNNAHIIIDYTHQESLGEDRIAAAIGAMELYPDDDYIVVVDAGSAITCDLIDVRRRRFVGGAILAGHSYIERFVDISRRLASAKKESLGKLSLPGHSTEESLRIGVIAQTAFAVEMLRRKYGTALGKGDVAAVITGGDAPKMLPYLSENWRMEKGLVLRGLYTAYMQDARKEKTFV